jgi:hypothetical protein
MKAINRSKSIHTPRSRDAALRRLSRVNRWLIAGSAVLTGVLTDVAANAFPGHTIRKGSARPTARKALAHARRHRPIAPPKHAPKPDTTTQQAAPPPVEEAQAPSTEAAEAPPAETPAPATHEAAPEPTHESAPAPAEEAPHTQASPPPEEPVVSGGS